MLSALETSFVIKRYTNLRLYLQFDVLNHDSVFVLYFAGLLFPPFPLPSLPGGVVAKRVGRRTYHQEVAGSTFSLSLTLRLRVGGEVSVSVYGQIRTPN